LRISTLSYSGGPFGAIYTQPLEIPQPCVWKTRFHLFCRSKGRGREALSSLLRTGSKYLFQSGFVSSRYLLRGMVKDLCVSEPSPSAGRR